MTSATATGRIVLEARDLHKSYATASGALTILTGIDLVLCAGESVAIMGPSGSGKSTLLHLFGTLDDPTSGTVKINGREIAALSTKEKAALRNHEIGFVFQESHLLPQCTLLENVLIPTLVSDLDKREARTRAEELIQRVGLEGRAAHRPAELSGGERQRAAVARALIHQPMLLLCDEPTGSLDHANAQEIGTLLRDLQTDPGVALVVVTHNRELASRFDRVLFLTDGRLSDRTAPG